MFTTFLIDLGAPEMTAITGYAKNLILDMTPMFLLLVGVAIGMVVLSGVVSLIKH